MIRYLNTYYSNVNKIIEKHLPEGNFFSDWIADEYFAVFFVDQISTDNNLIKSIVKVAEEILIYKEKFCEQEKFHFGIDIGLAAGVSNLGMIGPASHRKATAIGSVPGVSRRIQTFGKMVRLRNGEKDRILFDSKIEGQMPNAGLNQKQDISVLNVNEIEEKYIYYTDLSQLTTSPIEKVEVGSEVGSEVKVETNVA